MSQACLFPFLRISKSGPEAYALSCQRIPREGGAMRCLLVVTLTGIASLTVTASANAQWRETKWEVSPFAGYETNGTFTVTPSPIAITVTKLRANANLSFGSFLDYSLTTNAQLEFMWNRNPTTYSEQQSPNTAFTKAYHSNIDQFQFGGLFTFLGSEHKLRPYIPGGFAFTPQLNTQGDADPSAFCFSLSHSLMFFF